MSWASIASSAVKGVRIKPAASSLAWGPEVGVMWRFMFLAVTAVAMNCQMWMTVARTPEQLEIAQTAFRVSVWGVVLCLVAFVLFHIRAGRVWLAGAVVLLQALWLASPVSAGGRGDVRLAAGAGSFLLAAFVLDATLTLWRRGERRRALTAVGGIVLLAAAMLLHAASPVPGPLASLAFFSLVLVGLVLLLSHDFNGRSVPVAQLIRQLLTTKSELMQSERRIQLAAEAADFGVWEWNLVDDTIWASRTARKLFGFGPSEGLDVSRIRATLNIPGPKALVMMIRTQDASGAGFEYEHRLTLPNGATRWVHTVGRVEDDDRGTPSVMRGVSVDVTDRRETQKRFELVMQAAPVGLVIVNGEGKIIQTNARVEADFGYTKQELAGQPITILSDEPFEELTPEGTVLCPSSSIKTMTGYRKDRTPLIIEVGCNHLQPEFGRDVLFTIIDSSERRAREARVVQERAFLRHVIDINPNLIFVKDADGRFTLVNQATADVFNLTVEDLVGKRDCDINPNAQEVEHFRRVDREVMKSKREQYIAEEVLTDASGRKHWLQTVKVSIPSQDGTALHVLGTSTDITYRKKIELALRESEQRFQEVCQISGEFIWEADASGMYTYASPSVTKILGFEPQELVGKMRLHSTLLGALERGLPSHSSLAYADRVAVRPFVCKSGRVVHLETRAAAQLNELGELAGFRGADIDVTERLRAEQEIVQQRKELTHLSRVNLVSELSGSIAHELNQPLAAILSNAQAALRFLARGTLNLGEVVDILRDIVEADKRASEIMQGMRLLLKKGEIKDSFVDLNEVAQDVMRLMRSELLSIGIVPTVTLAPGLPRIKGDRIQLQQVALNIVVNGCDAMAHNQPHDRALSLRTEIAEDSSVRFVVSDQGGGIPQDHLNKIFDPFFTTKPNGLGMGLAVCRRIISAHGGRINAVNGKRGASVSFTVPACTKELAS
jgi:PAS domain S-box-containing protein